MRTTRLLTAMFALLLLCCTAASAFAQNKTQPVTKADASAKKAPASGTAPAASQPVEEAESVEIVEIEEPAMTAEEEAIRANAAKFVEAYNRRDSKTMASMWSPEAVYMDPRTGERVVGRDEIAKQFDYTFAGSEDAKLAVTVDSVDFVSPNVAIEKGTAEVTYKDHEPEVSTYTAVHVKRDGEWLMDRVTESDVPPPPPTHYDELKELEWMVGSWIDEDETATIQTDCEWTKNRNFMTRSFAVVVGDEVDMSGMQIIAWDPAAKQIRSWVFDSDGTFGEGTWTQKDNRWLIKQVGTLPDGKKTSATNIITKVDDDSFTWQSTNREVGGEMLPNVEEVLVVRKPAE